MNTYKVVLIICIALATATATINVNLEYPTRGTLSEEEVTHIGQAAPGQEITLIFSRERHEGAFYWSKATSNIDGSGYYSIPRDKALEEILPPETIKENNLGNRTYLALKLRIPREGNTFKFNVTLLPREGFGDSATRQLSVDIEKDVYDFKIQEKTELQAGKKGAIEGTIKSNSIAVEEFTFKPSKLPEEWLIRETGETEVAVRVRPGETKQFTLPLQIDQEGQYEVTYSVRDTAKTHVGTYDVALRVKPTFRSKLKGFTRGHSVTMPLLQPFYSLLSLLG